MINDFGNLAQIRLFCKLPYPFVSSNYLLLLSGISKKQQYLRLQESPFLDGAFKLEPQRKEPASKSKKKKGCCWNFIRPMCHLQLVAIICDNYKSLAHCSTVKKSHFALFKSTLVLLSVSGRCNLAQNGWHYRHVSPDSVCHWCHSVITRHVRHLFMSKLSLGYHSVSKSHPVPKVSLWCHVVCLLPGIKDLFPCNRVLLGCHWQPVGVNSTSQFVWLWQWLSSLTNYAN